MIWDESTSRRNIAKFVLFERFGDPALGCAFAVWQAMLGRSKRDTSQTSAEEILTRDEGHEIPAQMQHILLLPPCGGHASGDAVDRHDCHASGVAPALRSGTLGAAQSATGLESARTPANRRPLPSRRSHISPTPLQSNPVIGQL